MKHLSALLKGVLAKAGLGQGVIVPDDADHTDHLSHGKRTVRHEHQHQVGNHQIEAVARERKSAGVADLKPDPAGIGVGAKAGISSSEMLPCERRDVLSGGWRPANMSLLPQPQRVVGLRDKVAVALVRDFGTVVGCLHLGNRSSRPCASFLTR